MKCYLALVLLELIALAHEKDPWFSQMTFHALELKKQPFLYA